MRRSPCPPGRCTSTPRWGADSPLDSVGSAISPANCSRNSAWSASNSAAEQSRTRNHVGVRKSRAEAVAAGAADESGVAGLATRLGVTQRSLHRRLVAAVGAGPLQLARTRRAQTARALIESTALPITEVAFAAGYASLRQFNAAVQTAFGATPSALRIGDVAPSVGEGALSVRLRYRPPLDVRDSLGFIGIRSIPGVEEYEGGVYRRSLRLPRSRGIVEVEPGAGHLVLRLLLDSLIDLGTAVHRCRSLFDLDADPAAIATVLLGDPLLAPLVARRPGLRVPGSIDAFEFAVRAILGQQVSVAGARTLVGRLVAVHGEELVHPRGSVRMLFPTAERLAEANLDGLGITGARIRSLHALSAAVASDALHLDEGADRSETERRLLELPGIGPWSAASIAMRGLHDPDAFPAGDLGLRRALERMGCWEGTPALLATAERWRPWRAYAALHLWSSLSDPSPLEASA